MKRLIIMILASLSFIGCESKPVRESYDYSIHPPVVEVKAYPERKIIRAQNEAQLVELVLIEDFTEDDEANVLALTRMAQGEYFLIDTPEHKMQCAAVVECAMWRSMVGTSKGFASTPIEVVSQPYQFHGYDPYAVVDDELYEFVKDVYLRMMKVQDGADPKEVGCVLCKDYLWFWGDGIINHFTDAYPRGNEWTWEWGNPYV